MSTGNNDRRVNRTKEALQRALLRLMVEKGYEAMTVQDLVECANIGRSTFYSHYADKDDLLLESIDNLSRALRAQFPAAEQERRRSDRRHPALRFALPMFEHVHDVSALFLALVGKGSAPVVQEYMHDMLADLIREDLDPDCKTARYPQLVVVEFIVASFFAVATWWLTEEPERQPSDAHDLFVGLVLPAVKNAGL